MLVEQVILFHKLFHYCLLGSFCCVNSVRATAPPNPLCLYNKRQTCLSNILLVQLHLSNHQPETSNLGRGKETDPGTYVTQITLLEVTAHNYHIILVGRRQLAARLHLVLKLLTYSPITKVLCVLLNRLFAVPN